MSTIVFNLFRPLVKAMHVTVADIVHETTEGIFHDADATVRANSTRTGDLARSGRTEYSDDGQQAIVGYDDFKADWVEYGTGEPGPTRAEPFLTPAAEGRRERFETALRFIEPRLSVNVAGSVPLRAPQASRPR